MTVQTHVVTCTIDPAGLNVTAPIESGTLTMDAGWVPFHQGQITIPMDVGDLSSYLPNNVLPVRIDTSVVGDPGNFEQWNLHARHIRKDHLAGTYVIDVASAEALVQDWGADTSSTAFAADWTLGVICQTVLGRVLGDNTITVSTDAGGLLIANELRVWKAGTPAWDYLAEICNSMSGRTLSPTPFGGWVIRPAFAWDTSFVPIPSPEDALSYIEEWTREGDDFANAVTVEFAGGDPTYTMIPVPGSSPAVSVQVEIRSFGRAYLPIGTTAKPPLSKSLDMTTDLPRAAQQSSRDSYARYVSRRRRDRGYYLTWRTVSHYDVRPRMSIGDAGMFIDRVTHDFGTNEMSVSARFFTGDQ